MDNEETILNQPTINARFRSHSKLRGEYEVQLFDNFYLSVREKPLKRSREFKMELATLDPEAIKKVELNFPWLGAAVIFGLGSVLFIYLLFISNEWMAPLFGALVAAALSALFVTLFFYTSRRQWIFHTRNGLYPLVVIPFHQQQKKEVHEFVERVQQAIRKNVSSKGYSDEDLFAGELRMLRRMVKNKIMNEARYEQVKAHMMKNHGTVGIA